jgi:hypothetical protein
MHEQHGVNLTKNVEEANPSVIIYGLLQAFALIKGHHQGSLSKPATFDPHAKLPK